MTEYARLVVAVDSTQVGKARRELDKIPGSADSVVSSIKRIGAAIGAYMSVKAVINAADEYGQMASRMKQATASAEEYATVQARLLDTANRTYRPLAEAQELFIRTADSLKSLGYETSAALDITDSFSYLLVTNAASAERAGSAINAYSKAIQTGKVDSESWQSILAAMPTVVDGLAQATGRSTQEIRKLGVEGKLSLGALNESLRRTAETNGELADKMETSVGDAVTTLQNSFQVLVGKVNESTGATGGLVTSIESLADLLKDPKTAEGLATLTSQLVTLTGWMVQGAAATATFFDNLTDSLAGIEHLDGVQVLERAIHDTTVELNNLQGDLHSPDWMLSIRGLDRGQIEARVRSLKLDLQGLKGTLAEVRAEAAKPAAVVVPDASGKPAGVVAAEAAQAASQKASDALAKLYASQLASLQRQAALHGEVGEAARISYEIQSGALKGLGQKEAGRLMLLARELDLRRQLQEAEEAGDQYKRTMGEIAMGSGGNADIDRLNEAYFRRKEVIDAALAAEYLTKQQHDAAMIVLDQATADARSQVLYDYQRSQEQATLQTMGSIVSITQAQVQQMQELVEEGGAIGKAFFVMTQGLAAANAIINGFQSAMAIRVAYAQMAAMSGPAAPGVLAAGETHANVAQTMGFATAGMIAGQTLQSFDGGGFTGGGPRVGGLDGKGGFMAMVHPNETIIDHTRPGGKSGGWSQNVVVNLIEDASKAGKVEQRRESDGSLTMDAFVASLYGEGEAYQAISGKFGMRGVGK
ncbi:tape measure protein [Pseudomonas sp.]|uniref:tape measure protein n=1 Tax=Pseudomonas sp. TaxID=306 RepID=UPI002354ECBE|nr:tape measure protein [Pseudomonas sp.]